MKITMRDLLKAGIHFGHRKRYWNPKMGPYIFGVHEQTHIIDLEKTLPMFNDALNFLGNIASKKGKVMFVGTKHAAREIVKECAESCGMPFVNHRWLGGMLTNYRTVRRSIKRLQDLDVQFEKQAFGKLTKKEILNLTRERTKLEQSLGGIKNMKGLPDVLFVVDVAFEHTAIREAQKMKIPVVAVVDTNNSPEGLDFVIPGNDDALSAIRLYCESVAETVRNAKSSGAVFEDVAGGAEDEFVEVDE
jgi:small subunit ribosomal protein S2